MNADYQELINVILWKKTRNDITLAEFVCACLCNLLVINNSLYALLLNSYVRLATGRDELPVFIFRYV